jgi:parvulin-like peptidyl-prolyl isomerase
MAKKNSSKPTETRKQSRMRERDQEQQRVLFIVLGIVAALIVIVLAVGYWRTVIAVQDETVATVNGVALKVRDYQARARFDAQTIISRINSIQNVFQQFNADDPAMASLVQYYQNQLAQEQQALQQAPSKALENLIDDELVRQEAARRGITVTPAEIDREIELSIKENLGYERPTATPTNGPSPTPTHTQTPTLTPTNTATPSVSPTASATLSATLAATPTEGPTETPQPTQTPLGPEAYATEEAKLKENISKLKISFEDYRKIVEIDLLRQRLNEALGAEVKTTAEQVHVAHILVKTFEEAQAVEARLQAGEDFGALAAELSIDPSAKTNQGDLGWAARGQFVTEFENAAFSLPVLQVSAPVTSSFGVHIIKVLEKDANRVLEAAALEQARASALSDWLQTARANAGDAIKRFFSTDYIPSEVKRLTTAQ